MSDLIRREDAIEALTEIITNLKTVYGDMGSAVNGARECIKSLPSVEPERKTKIEMNWATYFDNMGTAVIHIPYSYKCGNCGCQLQRTYDGIDINYCPECGYRLEWK